MKKSDKIIDYLVSKGCKEIESKSKKCRTFKFLNSENCYFVGKNGSLRRGKNYSSSISLTSILNPNIF